MTTNRVSLSGEGDRLRERLLTGNRGFTLVELLIVTVIVVITMGMVAGVLVSSQRNYGAQRERIETQQQARAAVDMITRLIHMSGNDPRGTAGAQPLAAAPGNTMLNSIRVQADWNPADGVLDDRYENVAFTVVNGQLLMSEAGGPAMLFADRIQGLTFVYFDTNGVALTNPAASASQIAYVTLTVTTQSSVIVQDGPPLVVQSAATVRRRE